MGEGGDVRLLKKVDNYNLYVVKWRQGVGGRG